MGGCGSRVGDDCGPRVGSCGSSAGDDGCGPRVGDDCGPRVGGCGPRVGSCGPRVGGCGPRVGGCGPRVGGCNSWETLVLYDSNNRILSSEDFAHRLIGNSACSGSGAQDIGEVARLAPE